MRLNEAYTGELSAELFASWCDELWQGALVEDAKRRCPDELYIGRGSVLRCALPSGRTIILRLCRRGGMMKALTRYRFFRRPGTSLDMLRPYQEMEVLLELSRAGLRVPTPVGAAIVLGSFGCSYRGFLATEEVPTSENLLQRLAELRGRPGGGEQARELCRQAGQQAGRMLAAGIFHADLHLGNILVADNNEIFLIDFDKSSRFPPEKLAQSKERLIRRWRKSVRKHRVRYPDALLAADEGFLSGLNESLSAAI